MIYQSDLIMTFQRKIIFTNCMTTAIICIE